MEIREITIVPVAMRHHDEIAEELLSTADENKQVLFKIAYSYTCDKLSKILLTNGNDFWEPQYNVIAIIRWLTYRRSSVGQWFKDQVREELVKFVRKKFENEIK